MRNKDPFKRYKCASPKKLDTELFGLIHTTCPSFQWLWKRFAQKMFECGTATPTPHPITHSHLDASKLMINMWTQ